MNSNTTKTRVLIFIGSLRSGGKERRLIELLSYLKQKNTYEFGVVLTQNIIHYPDFYKLEIPVFVIKKNWNKNDPSVFFQFYRICKRFNPDLIHTWGRMQTFYSLPAVIRSKTPLINSQITAAPPKLSRWSANNLIDRINFYYSKVVLSNSKAGLEIYNPPASKSKVIYNGINMSRFENLPDVNQIKTKYGITTPYTVLMAASFTPNKDYNLFFNVADRVTQKRDDITFIGVGGHDEYSAEYKRLRALSAHKPRILFPGRISDVEALANACTVGVLFSNKSVHGEGISNSVMEYMSLGKPVIANDAGGTKEIVHHNINGYLITNESEEEIASLLLELVDNPEKARSFGIASKKIIDETFSLDRMGEAFEQVYQEALVAYPALKLSYSK